MRKWGKRNIDPLRREMIVYGLIALPFNMFLGMNYLKIKPSENTKELCQS